MPDLTALYGWYSKHWINAFAFLKTKWVVMVGGQQSTSSNEVLRVKIVKAPLSKVWPTVDPNLQQEHEKCRFES